MHPDRGIVCTYIMSDGISTKPDDQNTLTCQSTDTNDAPRNPLHGPVTIFSILRQNSTMPLLFFPLSSYPILSSTTKILIFFLCIPKNQQYPHDHFKFKIKEIKKVEISILCSKITITMYIPRIPSIMTRQISSTSSLKKIIILLLENNHRMQSTNKW